MTSSPAIICLLFTILFSITINSMEAYRLDNEQAHINNQNENNELTDAYFIQRLQILLAAAAAESKNEGDGTKESSSSDHIINTRLAMNRRPGLIRLKKND